MYEVARVTRERRPLDERIARIRTTSGRWLAVSGTAMTSQPGWVAIIVQQASPRQLIPALARWHGLTHRETAVLLLLLEGQTSRTMAERLRLSTYTVNDHRRAIYRKTATRGRDELIASVL